MNIKELIPNVKRMLDKNVKYSLLDFEYSLTKVEAEYAMRQLEFWLARQEEFNLHETEYPNDSYPKCKTCRDRNDCQVSYPCPNLIKITEAFLEVK